MLELVNVEMVQKLPTKNPSVLEYTITATTVDSRGRLRERNDRMPRPFAAA